VNTKLDKQTLHQPPLLILFYTHLATGILGQLMRDEVGFKGPIDILDASMEMLNAASKRSVDFRFFCSCMCLMKLWA